MKTRLFIVSTTYQLTRHWLAIFVIVFGIYNLLPFTAPIAMRLNLKTPADTIYAFYSLQCHQMAQRSFFLFGSQFTYNAEQLPFTMDGDLLNDMLALRDFRGNDQFGWKVAWSDRMVYMYGSLWIASIIYLLSSRKMRPLPIWIFLLMLIPMAVDGLSHMISDTNGLAAGFRYDNDWLAQLTGGIFSPGFYRGDAFGSFNSLMRLVSGVLFGIGAAGFALPFLNREMTHITHQLGQKQAKHELNLKLTTIEAVR